MMRLPVLDCGRDGGGVGWTHKKKALLRAFKEHACVGTTAAVLNKLNPNNPSSSATYGMLVSGPSLQGQAGPGQSALEREGSTAQCGKGFRWHQKELHCPFNQNQENQLAAYEK